MDNTKKIFTLLMELEKRCRMDICAPADSVVMQRLSAQKLMLPQEVMELYGISDGIEINVPGTRIFPATQIKKTVQLPDKGRATVIGIMNFGDEIAVCSDGSVIQIDHETGNIFLEWGSFAEFLEDELEALGEGCG